jgi:uncharacterized protein
VIPIAAPEGVRINLVSREKLGGMTVQEKIRFILDEVKRNRILVLEQGLSPTEEAKLIETTMIEIDPDTFIGIEMESQHAEKGRGMGALMKRKNLRSRATMTVVGPADKLRTVRKDGSTIEAMILTGREAKVAG